MPISFKTKDMKHTLREHVDQMIKDYSKLITETDKRIKNAAKEENYIFAYQLKVERSAYAEFLSDLKHSIK